MTYLAAWLVAVGCADLARPGGALSPRGGRLAPVLSGAGGLVAVWLAVGLPRGRGLLVWAALLALVAVWVLASARAVAAGATSALDVAPGGLVAEGGVRLEHPAGGHVRSARPVGRGVRHLAVGALVAGTVLALLANGAAPLPVGRVADAYTGLRLRSLHGTDLARALVVLGVLLVQVGTANVVVRLGLDGAGARSEPGVLRGGRLVGPLERLFIVGLGLAGQVTAASIVIAAKGLLRFPELQKQGTAHQRIDVVTEYFVVGSFLSWLVALVGLCLARA